MHDAWTDRLSEHLDGTLPGEERALLEAHLATCPACPAILADLRNVAARARALPDVAPGADLWPGIEARIAAYARESHERAGQAGGGARVFPGPRRGLVLSWPQLAAAGIALVLLSGGATWAVLRGARTAAPVVAGVEGRDRAGATNATSAGAVEHELADELGQLEQVLAQKRGELDPETVKTIEANLKIIDLATTQARTALASDPANPYLKEHLAKTMKRKIEMLREATVLASAQ